MRSLEDRITPSVAMVADLNSYTLDSSPAQITNVNGTAFFTATTNSGNVELFASNGTAGGTTQLTFGVQYTNIGNLVSFNNKLFFTANDYQNYAWQTELMTSDGTVVGTHPFVANGANVAVAYQDSTSYAVVGSKFYFEARDAGNQYTDLWVSDGTSAGTHPVQPGSATTPNSNLDNFTAVGTKLFFESRDTNTGNYTLWTSTGTAAGTGMVTELAGGNQATNLTAFGSKLVFQMYDSTNSQYALWQSTGTSSGTSMVADIGTTGSQFSVPTVLGSKLFFQVNDSTDAPLSGWTLWDYDGTHAPAVFKYGGGTTAVNTYGAPLIVMGSNLYFSGYDATNGPSLWKTDGSSTGTTGTVQTSGATPFNTNAYDFTVSGSELYFHASLNGVGNVLWKTNGTSVGTVPVQSSGYGFDGGGGSINAFQSTMAAVGSKFFFSAYDLDANGNSPHGRELWVSDGTGSGTGMVTDINTVTGSSSPSNFVPVGNEMFFAANTPSPVNGTFLWQSDGTAANTMPVQTSDGTVPSNPGMMIAVGNTLFFAASGPNDGTDLWTTGTGTKSATELFPTAGTNPFDGYFDSAAFVNLGGTLYFGAIDAATGSWALWKSNGTAAGTQVVQDLGANAPTALTVVGTNLFWNQWDSTNSVYALWESNGTTANQVADINSNNFDDLTAVGGRLYFRAQDVSTGIWGLWTSTGTAASTVQLAQFDGNPPTDLNSFNNELFFAGHNSTLGQYQMWTSTGTAAGTTPFLNGSGQPVGLSENAGDYMLVAGNQLYFTQYDWNVGLNVLAKTDGTAAGTVEVQAGTTGTIGQNPAYLAYANGEVLFQASDPTHGYQLWQSDGTAGGTMLMADINGANSSWPSYMTAAGNQVFLSAYTDANGSELWSATPSTTVVTAGISGPTDGVTMQQRPFVLTASDSNSGNNAAGFSFAINWGDGSTQTTTGQSGLSVAHQYATTGNFTVTVTATNLADGVSSLAVSQVDGIAQDELQGGNMVVGGVPGNDAITVTKGNKATNYTIKYNGTAVVSNFVPVTGEQIFLYGGNGTNTVAVTDSGTAKDTFTLGAGYVTFAKAILVPQMPVSWTVTGNSSTLGNIFNIQAALTANVTGSTGPDTINILNGASLTGTLAGGGGVDTLTYAKYSHAVQVNLLQGLATAISGGVSNIRNVTGSAVGGDILVGDTHANVLRANKGHNILIGGSGGGDTLYSAGLDILIAGKTTYDSSPTGLANLQTILNTWNTATTGNYASVINTISSPSFAAPLNTSTVFDTDLPDLADTLIGKSTSDVDWFFAHTSGGSQPNDTITNQGSMDTVTGI